MEFSNTDSSVSVEAEVDSAIAGGIQVVVQCDNPWNNLSNVIAWGNNFGNKLLAIEFGNEDNYSYKGTSGDGAIYGANYNTVHAGLGGDCPLWAQGGDPHFGSGWTAAVRGVGGAANTPDAWICHPYGPPPAMGLGTRSKDTLDDCMAKTTGDVWVTEWGITTDNDVTFTKTDGVNSPQQTYDWPNPETYNNAATGFTDYMTWITANYARVKGLAVFQSHDQHVHHFGDGSEWYFGIVQNGGSAKGNITSTFATLCALYHD
jgi:hypothetical protein